MAENATTVRLRILGRVQGVGYRAWTVQTARRLGLQGWVRNVTDGAVEALAHGPQDAVASLIAAAHAGPPGARVTEVQSQSLDLVTSPNREFQPGVFHQLGTAAPDGS